ncbi:MFS transporter [Occultella aeris]|uniref:Multidrug resistance protein MdtH n=1 Tax=Occultella aeris TaxID=2761496 RepID=A0A7M4DIB3_9MICO|nr:MFS transporter [Occultella aeris]VZO36684.1 Multidrug resistance protein MdtH [Occultella aeris]
MTDRSSLRSFSRPVQVLVLNQFGVNLGFYLLLPFLAAYLTESIGLTLAAVGLVLGARNLAQQGLFLVGGICADRIGSRPMILAGCLLRVIGFGMFALTENLWGLLAAALLSGVAGALFNPAVRSYVATASQGRTAEAFAWFALAGNAGMFVGPVLGALLMLVDFRIVAAVAAGVFAVLTIAQAIWLPAQSEGRAAPERGGMLGLLRNGRFWLFALAGSALFALQNQLYLIFPREADPVLGGNAGTVSVFVVSTVVAVACQRPLTRYAMARWQAHRSIALGYAVMGVGLLGPAATAAADPAVRFTAILLAAAALGLGVVIAQPFMLERIAQHASTGMTGTYYGAFYLLSGVIAAASGAGLGALLERSAPLSWLACGIAALAAAALSLLPLTAPRAPGPSTPIPTSTQDQNQGPSKPSERSIPR